MRVLPPRPVRPGLPGGEPVPPRPLLMGERWAGRRLPRVLLPYLSRDIEGELSRWEREKMRRHGVFEDDISRWEAERDRADAALRERRRRRREERLQEEARRERERFLDELSDIPRESRRPVRSKPRRPEPEEILPDIEEEGWLPEEVVRALERAGIKYDRLGRPRSIKTGGLIVRGPGGRLIVGRPEGEGGFVTVRRPGEEPITKEIQPRPRIEPGPRPDISPAEILHHFGLLPGLPEEQEAAVRWARDALQRGDLEHTTRHGVPYTLDTPQEFITIWEEERRGAKLHPKTIEMIYALPWPAGGRVEVTSEGRRIEPRLTDEQLKAQGLRRRPPKGTERIPEEELIGIPGITSPSPRAQKDKNRTIELLLSQKERGLTYERAIELFSPHLDRKTIAGIYAGKQIPGHKLPERDRGFLEKQTGTWFVPKAAKAGYAIARRIRGR